MLLWRYLGTVFGVPGVGESPVSPFDVVDDPSFLSLEAWNQFDDQQPRLYLNYLLYDNHFNLVDFGFDQVSEAAKVPGDTTLLVSHAFEELVVEVTAQQAGFIYIYVSNENDQNVTAYFDDLGVEHTYGNIAVATDFYPFGLAVAGRELERIKWRYGYQGEFAEKDEETGWNSFELRMYDPVIGRWTTTDPAGQFWSPYLGMGNSPVNQIDPDGAYSKFGAWWRSKFHPESEAINLGSEWAVQFSSWKSDGSGGYLQSIEQFTEGRIVFGFEGVNWVNEAITTYKVGFNNIQDKGTTGFSIDGGSFEVAQLNLDPNRAVSSGNFNDLVQFSTPENFTQGIKIETGQGDLKFKLNYNPNNFELNTVDVGVGFPFLEFKVTLDQHGSVHRVRLGSQEDIGTSAAGNAVTASYFTGFEYKPR